MISTRAGSAVEGVEDTEDTKVVVEGFVVEIVVSSLVGEGELVSRVVVDGRHDGEDVPDPGRHDVRVGKEGTSEKRKGIADQHFQRVGINASACNGCLEGVVELVDRLVEGRLVHDVVRVEKANLLHDHKDYQVLYHLHQSWELFSRSDAPPLSHKVEGEEVLGDGQGKEHKGEVDCAPLEDLLVVVHCDVFGALDLVFRDEGGTFGEVERHEKSRKRPVEGVDEADRDESPEIELWDRGVDRLPKVLEAVHLLSLFFSGRFDDQRRKGGGACVVLFVSFLLCWEKEKKKSTTKSKQKREGRRQEAKKTHQRRFDGQDEDER